MLIVSEIFLMNGLMMMNKKSYTVIIEGIDYKNNQVFVRLDQNKIAFMVNVFPDIDIGDLDVKQIGLIKKQDDKFVLFYVEGLK